MVYFEYSSDLSRKLVLCSEQSGYPGTNSAEFGKDKRLIRSMETATKKLSCSDQLQCLNRKTQVQFGRQSFWEEKKGRI